METNTLSAELRDGVAWPALRAQLLRVRRPVAVVLTIVAAVGLAIVGLSVAADAPLYDFTMDPTSALGELRPYTGMLSTLGVMGWAASITLYGLAALRRGERSAPQDLRFWASSLALSAVLGVDDAFLVHEVVLPVYVGVPEPVTLVAYMVLAALYLLMNWRRILRSDYLLLVAALAGLSLSLMMDVLLPFSSLGSYVEDLCKFGGILFWFSYSARCCATSYRRPPSAADRAGMSAVAVGR